MKPIHFRGKNYDAQMVSRLAGQGHRQIVDTADVISIAAQSGYDNLVAVRLEDKFHLLTGKIDATKPQVELHILSTVQLKKALVEPVSYEQRQQASRDHQAHVRSSGFNDYGNWRGR